MIYKNIETLLPFVDENFLTFPLWEEGKYIPFVNFWRKYDLQKDYEIEYTKFKKFFKKTGYVIAETDVFGGCITYYEIYPDFKELKDGSYEYKKHDWSIEEMLEMLNEILIYDKRKIL
jgi:hypothetical protein